MLHALALALQTVTGDRHELPTRGGPKTRAHIEDDGRFAARTYVGAGWGWERD